MAIKLDQCQPYERIYKCADRWIYVHALTDQETLFNQTITGKGEADEKSLEAAFAKQPCSHWEDKLAAAGIACHPVFTLDDVCTDIPTYEAQAGGETLSADEISGAVNWPNHPWGRPATLLESDSVRIGEDRSYKRLTSAPRMGQDTRAILAELGYTEDEINELIRLKVAHTFMPWIGSEEKFYWV